MRGSFRQINNRTGDRLQQQLVDEVTREPVKAHDKYEVGQGVYLQEDDELEAKVDSTESGVNVRLILRFGLAMAGSLPKRNRPDGPEAASHASSDWPQTGSSGRRIANPAVGCWVSIKAVIKQANSLTSPGSEKAGRVKFSDILAARNSNCVSRSGSAFLNDGRPYLLAFSTAGIWTKAHASTLLFLQWRIGFIRRRLGFGALGFA